MKKRVFLRVRSFVDMITMMYLSRMTDITTTLGLSNIRIQSMYNAVAVTHSRPDANMQMTPNLC